MRTYHTAWAHARQDSSPSQVFLHKALSIPGNGSRGIALDFKSMRFAERVLIGIVD